ncbi:MAG: NAD(P)-dependent oxidoreductase [Herpetosiphonaceae bacterium]|nr:MAG: NAD(P)-dependent oxidoreductase [Herpetosiphonaceae bacterium]
MSKRLLVTGASGLLGSRVAALARDAGWQVVGTFCRHPQPIDGVEMLPLALPAGIAGLIRDLRPDAVVHTAYSREPEVMWRVIVEGSAATARTCRTVGARLLHISSDAIFAGRPEPYTEADVPDPVFPYGAAKAAAEAVVAALNPEALQIRTSLLYSPPGASRPDPYMLMAQNLLRNPEQGYLFTDEYRCPICVDDLAAAIVELLDRKEYGVLHIAGPAALSRYAFGRLLVRAAGMDPAGLPAGSAGSLRRPSHVLLDTSRARRLLRTALRSPYDVLGDDHEPPA